MDDPAAITFDGDGDAEVVGNAEGLFVFDTRGDGFTEDVGVGDACTVGVAVAVTVGLVRVCIGVGVGVGVGDGDVVAPVTVIVPCIWEG